VENTEVSDLWGEILKTRGSVMKDWILILVMIPLFILILPLLVLWWFIDITWNIYDLY